MILAYTLNRRCQLYGTNRLFPLRKIVRSKEEIAKMREHSMRLSDFHIGLEFWMSSSHWRCTDVGSRVVVAIKLEHDDDPGMYNGPPYKICECPLDEYVHHICSLTPNSGNSGQDDEDMDYSPLESPEIQRAKWKEKWDRDEPIRERHAAAEWAALTAHRAKQRLPPMTQEQLDAEAAYAKKIYEEFQNPNSDLYRKVDEALKRRRPKLD